MSHCLGLSPPLFCHFKSVSVQSNKHTTKNFSLYVRSSYQANGDAQKLDSSVQLGVSLFSNFTTLAQNYGDTKLVAKNKGTSGAKQELVAEVKEKLNKEHNSLPLGKYGRDDEEMIHWFLKDRKYSVRDAVSKLTKAIRWRHEFGASELTEESVKSAAESGKAYVHDHLDVYGRPVMIGNLSKHIPGDQAPYEDEKLCVFLIEKALGKLPPGKHEILVIIDLRRFETHNVDIKLLPFMFEAFCYYYPSRMTQILLVGTPFIYMTVWPLICPFLGPSASLVKFCSAREVRDEYFTRTTVPAVFRD